MMKTVLILLATLLLLAQVACSDAETSKNEASETKKVEAKQSESTDPLAAKRSPIRNEDNKIVTLDTELGRMTLELYHDIAPAHADSFLARCEDDFLSGTLFHRVVKGFMIQGGNPVPVGKTKVSYYLPDELNNLPHLTGTLSMASTGLPTSAKTQFFICLARARSLDNKYVVFGQLLKGFDVLNAIGNLKVGPNKWQGGSVSLPLEEVHVIKGYLSDAEGNALE